MQRFHTAILCLDIIINCALGYLFGISALLCSAYLKEWWLDYKQFFRLVQFHEAILRGVRGQSRQTSYSWWDHLRIFRGFVEAKLEEMGNQNPKPTDPPPIVEESSGFHLVELHYTSIGWSVGALVVLVVVVVAAVMLTIRLRAW